MNLDGFSETGFKDFKLFLNEKSHVQIHMVQIQNENIQIQSSTDVHNTK